MGNEKCCGNTSSSKLSWGQDKRVIQILFFFRKTVVSSAYCVIFISCAPTLIPLILGFCINTSARISNQGRIVCLIGDDPLWHLAPDWKRLRGITIVCDTASYAGPKLSLSRALKRKFHSIESNAFSKLRKTARPGRLFAALCLIISLISLTFSPMYHPVSEWMSEPVWPAFITKSRMASSLIAIAFVPILQSVFKSKIGLRLPRKLVVFFSVSTSVYVTSCVTYW